jgi:large subunit ribosomal protein L24
VAKRGEEGGEASCWYVSHQDYAVLPNTCPADANRDTPPNIVQQVTFKPPSDITASLRQFSSDPYRLFPTTVQSPAPTDLYGSDMYLAEREQHHLEQPNPDYDIFMPLHLQDEVSSRFGKHTTKRIYDLRVEAAKRQRAEAGENAVQEWINNGRDRNLRRVMDLDEVGLEGVPLRRRTIKEVREQAEAEFDEAKTTRRMDLVSRLDKRGMKWDYELNGWIRGPKTIRFERKKANKVKKAKKLELSLQNLTLSPGKNMVIPEGMQRAVKVKRIESS